MSENIKNSSILKIISHILLPIILVVIMLSVAYTSYIAEYKDYLTADNFYDTERYQDYMNLIKEYPRYYSDTNVFVDEQIFNIAKALDYIPTVLIPVEIAIAMALTIYLFFAIGHKKDYEGIYQNKFEKWPIEIIWILAFFVMGFVGAPLISMLSVNIGNQYQITLTYFITLGLLIVTTFYGCLAVAMTATIKKLKTSTLINSSLTYKIIMKISNFFRIIKETMFNGSNTNIKIVAVFIGLLLLSVILASMGGIGVILLAALWSYILYKIMQKVDEFKKIKDTTKEIYEGDYNKKIDATRLNGDLKELSMYINDIAGGFSNAIEQSLKSERLKTELITNVSHDIKTPLTSIINYVDLLKKEDIKNDKANEYIEVLDSKSQRLKKLTEDLIEASKVSSGNIKLDLERIDVVELIKQTIGEFDDKFKEKNLEIIQNIPGKEVNIKADSRYMYRIVENIFSNISKYSQENSRVYIDMKQENGRVITSFKNMSKEKLNISIDELMERFVRGEKSRTTEGSGLGLSISRSLAELQNGKFEIVTDGDLFKVNLIFKEFGA